MKRVYDRNIKNKARGLRRKGKSYGKISKIIRVPKSTLSLWLKYVPLSETDRKRLYTKQVKLITYGKFSQKNRRQKQIKEIIIRAQEDVPIKILDETYRFIGVALYWAEGTKKGLFEITNSDPKLILFMVQWIKKIFKIPGTKLKARLNIHGNQNEKKIINFWSKLCGIPIKNFSKSFIKPANKNYKKNTLYYGTIKITIPKSTDLKYQTLAWLEPLLISIRKNVKLAERSFAK